MDILRCHIQNKSCSEVTHAASNNLNWNLHAFMEKNVSLSYHVIERILNIISTQRNEYIICTGCCY